MNRQAKCIGLIVVCGLFTVACGNSDDDSPANSKQSSKPSPKKKADAAVDAGVDAADAASSAAGSTDAGGASTCDARDCWCEMFCANVAAADCAADQPQADCEDQCKTAMTPGCEAEDLTVVRCEASRPQSAFGCDLNQHIYTVKGCDTEREAFDSCLFM
jgi:hypothetical protein